MSRTSIGITLLATITLCGCQGNADQSPGPVTGGPPGGGVSPPLSGSGSVHYHGPYVDDLPGVGRVEINYHGCEGFVVGTYATGGRCIDLLVDGNFEMIPSVEPGSIIELDYQPKSASTADVQHAVIGPVEAIDAGRARLVVLGQVVHVTDSTLEFGKFSGDGIASLDGVSVGDEVMVSGYFSPGGDIIATLIRYRGDPRPRLLRGILATAPDGTFHIGDLQLDLSTTDFRNFPGGTAQAGDAVLLTALQDPVNSVLPVDLLTYASRDYSPVARREVTGFITAVRGYADIDIGGNGVWVENCQVGDELNASGRGPAAGNFVSYLQVADDRSYLSLSGTTRNRVALTGPIESNNADAGFVTVLGFTVQTNVATYVSAESNPRIGSPGLALEELDIGETVKVQGDLVGNTIVADLLTREPSDSGLVIRMIAFELADPDIVFLGRAIRTGASTSVFDCGYYDDVCTAADITWLFDENHAQPDMLVIAVDAAGSELRATRIDAFLAEPD